MTLKEVLAVQSKILHSLECFLIGNEKFINNTIDGIPFFNLTGDVDEILRGVLVMSALFLLFSIGDTVSLTKSADATRLIGTMARMGAFDRPLIDCDTRILRFRVVGGAGGFFIMP